MKFRSFLLQFAIAAAASVATMAVVEAVRAAEKKRAPEPIAPGYGSA